ncbi:MAG TPA: 4-vinyl reductase [Bacteroidales bacterium]|nr:4-vinyl reductase [Bacteroidales bacterium]
MKEYPFRWKDIGDIQLGRPNLGQMTHVAVYRLMQYTMRAVLEERFGIVAVKELFVEAGRLAGQEFCKNLLNPSLPLNEFIAELHDKLIELSVGILRVERADPEKLSFVVTVSEDLDCSGLPITGRTVCDYDEGFIEGIFNIYTGKDFSVKEVDCWSTGERTCRFTIDRSK